MDCACSRTLAGTTWTRHYIKKLQEAKIPYIIIEQDENFKFGGPKIYQSTRSTRAVVGWLAINGRWFMIKVSVVAASVPLLLSRPVLAALGMNYKMASNVADFTQLDLKEVFLGFTATGHPCVNAVDFGPVTPSWPEKVDWSLTEVHVPDLALTAFEAYTVSAASGLGRSMFYPKVRGHVHELLSRDVLPPEPFLHWWKEQSFSRDFWIETEHDLLRIHVDSKTDLF